MFKLFLQNSNQLIKSSEKFPVCMEDVTKGGSLHYEYVSQH